MKTHPYVDERRLWKGLENAGTFYDRVFGIMFKYNEYGWTTFTQESLVATNYENIHSNNKLYTCGLITSRFCLLFFKSNRQNRASTDMGFSNNRNHKTRAYQKYAMVFFPYCNCNYFRRSVKKEMDADTKQPFH